MKIQIALDHATNRRDVHCCMHGATDPSHPQPSHWDIPEKQSEINILTFMAEKLGADEEYSYDNIIRSLDNEEHPRTTLMKLFTTKRDYDDFSEYGLKGCPEIFNPLYTFIMEDQDDTTID